MEARQFKSKRGFESNEDVQLEAENCGKWVPKRSSKVDTFIFKRLKDAGLGFTRYYETCVTETKGSLHLQNVILTDQFLFTTESPPKTIQLTVPLANIEDINLVADRKTLISGGNNSYICQHLRLTYREDSIDLHKNISLGDLDDRSLYSKSYLKSKRKSSKSNDSSKSNESSKSNDSSKSNGSSTSTSTTISTASSSLSFSSKFRGNFYNKNGFIHSPDVGYSDECRSSSRLDGSSIPLSVSHSYETLVNLSSVISPESSPVFFVEKNAQSIHGESKSTLSEHTTNGTKSSRESLTQIHSLNQRSNRKEDRMPSKKGYGSYSTEIESCGESPGEVYDGRMLHCKTDSNRRYHSIGSRRVVDSRTNNSEPVARPSWGKEQSRKSRVNGQEEREERRPRSVDISQFSSLRNKLFGKVFGDSVSSSENEKVLKRSTQQLVRGWLKDRESADEDTDSSLYGIGERSNSSSKDDITKDKTGLKTLNLYVYQPNSALLNELFLFWHRTNLNFLQQKSSLSTIKSSDGKDDSKRGYSSEVDTVFAKLLRTWTPLDTAIWRTDSDHSLSFNTLLPNLEYFLYAIRKHHHLRRLCWKKWDMIVNLVGILRKCTQNLASEETVVIEEDKDYFLDRVSSIAIIMDIFFVLITERGTQLFRQEAQTMGMKKGPMEKSKLEFNSQKSAVTPWPINIHQLTHHLLEIILECNWIPHRGITSWKEITNIISNPQTFSTGDWYFSRHAKAIRLITIAHNASATLLHEIFEIIHFSTEKGERTKFIGYLQGYNMEGYAKLSVTQVINLLWSKGHPMGPAQAVLLQRHVSTLKTLWEYKPKFKSFLSETFSEEFRYFVHEESTNKRIPDQYPLKLRLIASCGELREEIINNSSIATAKAF